MKNDVRPKSYCQLHAVLVQSVSDFLTEGGASKQLRVYVRRIVVNDRAATYDELQPLQCRYACGISCPCLGIHVNQESVIRARRHTSRKVGTQTRPSTSEAIRALSSVSGVDTTGGEDGRKKAAVAPVPTCCHRSCEYSWLPPNSDNVQ